LQNSATYNTETIKYNANFKSDHDEIASVIELAQEWLDSISNM